MDLASLHETFAATLSPDHTLRTNAESTLHQLEAHPEFTTGCLDLLLSPDVSPGVKSAAGVYLKNTVAKVWRATRPVNAAEFRSKLLQGLCTSAPMHRPIFLVVLYRVIDVDYPEHWPDLVPQLHSMLSSDDVNTVWAGLSGVLKVCLHYRWSSLKGLDEVLASIYPLCLSVAEAAVESDTDVAGSMLYDFAKIYKYTTSRSLPPIMQSMQVIGRTVQVFVRVLQKQIHSDLDESEREYTPWAKAKKWSSFNLLRTQVAYVSNLSSLSTKGANLGPFRSAYSENLTPHVLEAFLKLLEQWSQNLWLPKPAICNLLSYLETAPLSKQMWLIVEPYVDGLLRHIIYPLLCPSEEDIMLFETEPVEYLHKNANDLFEKTVPDRAAENLLLQLVQSRKNTFSQVIQFIQENKDTSGMPPAHRAGFLRMLDGLSKVITMKNNPIKTSMESFIVEFVLPDTDPNQHPIVRCYAMHLIGTYANLEFNRSSLQRLYEVVQSSLYDAHLPIQVESARALQGLAEKQDVCDAIGEHIPRILQHLLDLTKRVDLDNILVVMDDLINMHPDKVTPFAIELVSQLRDQFLSTASEIAEAANTMPENIDLDEDDVLGEKKATASSILRTMENLQYSLEKQTDILVQLESVIMPVFRAVYEHELIEFYPEALALHENTICCTKRVSPQMWEILPMCITAIEAGALECLDDANPVFENYITFGADALAGDSNLRDILMKLILNIISPEHESMLTAADTTMALQLAKRMLGTEQLRNGGMDVYIEPLLTSTFQKIAHGKARIESHPPYGTALVGTVQAAIYNTPGALEVISKHQMVQAFTQLWFQLLSDIRSVDGLKFQELAVLAILLHMTQEWSEYLPQLMKILAMTIDQLPSAISRLEEQRKSFDEDEYDDDGGYEADDWDDIGDEFAEDKENVNFNNKTETNFKSADVTVEINPAKHEFIQYDFSDDRDMNPFLQRPLDELNPFLALKKGLEELNSGNPQVYAAAMGGLEESDKAILQDGVLRAP